MVLANHSKTSNKEAILRAVGANISELEAHQDRIVELITTNASSIIDLAHHFKNINATAATNAIEHQLQLNGLELANLPEIILEFVRENRGTAWNLIPIILLLTSLFPSPIWLKVLWELGLIQVGPVAGGVFAFAQRIFGTPWLMRMIQSAAMGGWGVTVMNTFTRASALLARLG
ncbi:hypothetical protein CBER1_08635 [Cercospora berteroae]|uniref:Uncharacterized protein n=1 Tax=Cercospora berteroae TaxID=357750 RepID=A0A2S6BVR2_9PEZI|nr:hypothetical protein CBER1_08635 [Cercospora berteroae]